MAVPHIDGALPLFSVSKSHTESDSLDGARHLSTQRNTNTEYTHTNIHASSKIRTLDLRGQRAFMPQIAWPLS